MDSPLTQQVIVGLAVIALPAVATGVWRIAKTVTRVESILIGADGTNGIRGELRDHLDQYARDKRDAQDVHLDWERYRATEQEWRDGADKRFDRLEQRGRRSTDPYRETA